ncbi:NAD-dependent protein deacylase [Ectobacillus sp. JY-23]|uniref:NAD-dependent protein deacylase n=1 Tax=Ectobacillus sp. JY-23 TaxID=2933872 RepID=UPI001FF4AA3E|nr:NAD-dependent protein deacylase [Ectobacillus sp. JY-23]UOY92583.1 NAD-dependent protein deacylase [Ectobacillus sp. JY-23]
MKEYKVLADWIASARNIAFFTGAGMSTASGIPDFRSAGGFWTDPIRPEVYMSRSFYNLHPKIFWEKYKEIFQVKLLEQYDPNPGHLFIADLEKQGKHVTVLTQNIDGLHQKAGSTNVVELHGTLKTATCPKCRTIYDLSYVMAELVPRCNQQTIHGTCQFILNPDVVLYEDPVQAFSKTEEILRAADVFIVMGTSLQVSPVNTLPEYYAHIKKECKMALINRERTVKDDVFPVVCHDEIVSAVTALKTYFH